MRSLWTWAVGAAALCGTCAAGDLTPPPGPVAPTDRTTISPVGAALPIVIDGPGSYVLTGPLLDCIGCADPETHGIVIDADDVTLDLNGFEVVGDPMNSLSGIRVTGPRENVVVRNGVVRGWGESGVNALDARSARVEGVSATGNVGNGISAGFGGVVDGCSASGNGGAGVAFAFGATVRHSVAENNTDAGFMGLFAATASGQLVHDCVARGNGGNGVEVGDGSVVRSCSVTFNQGNGVYAAPGSVVSQVGAALNGGFGVEAPGALVHACSAVNNTAGSYSTPGGTLTDSN